MFIEHFYKKIVFAQKDSFKKPRTQETVNSSPIWGVKVAGWPEA